ncbi:MAG: NAD(P)-dependent oxidoreductase, partial [bacterium]
SGDEPGVFKEIYDFADCLGFTIACLGKTPVFSPAIKEATPDSVYAEAIAGSHSPKMFCSFKDGSKTQIELTSSANACGLVPDVRGGHNKEATLESLSQLYRLKKDGGILNSYGVVDCCQGVYNQDGSVDLVRSTVPGVFGVITTDHPIISRDAKRYLRKYFRGEGPTFVLYRPYHLCNIETPISLARAVLFNEPTCTPLGMFTEVITLAKRDLKPGEVLDGSGGYTVYGRMEKYAIARKENLLPFSLAQNIKMVKGVKKDEPLAYSDVQLDESSFILKLI